MGRRLPIAFALVWLFCASATPVWSANLPLTVGVFPTEGAAEVYYAQQLGYSKMSVSK